MSDTAAIIICTHNRSASLRRTLESLSQVTLSKTASWTVVLVNNASTDATPAVAKEFASRLPMSYREHSQPGKWGALNAAIDATEAGLILLTDDDVDFDQAWAQELIAAAARHPECAVFGGKIIPRWEDRPPPRWMLEHERGLLGGVAVNYDLGERERCIQNKAEAFYGANMALRRRVFADGYRFPDAIGPRGKERAPHGETGLVGQLIDNGKQAIYVPTAVVFHRNPTDRATEKWVRTWHKGNGVSEVRLGGAPGTSHLWCGIPRYLCRSLIESALKYGLTRWTHSSNVWLRHEIAMASAWGKITELRRQARLRKQSTDRI